MPHIISKKRKKGKFTNLHNEVDTDMNMNMNTRLDNTIILEKLEYKIVKIPQLSSLYIFLKFIYL